jgi:putative PIN family toxin of toxin-antitoxin system
VRVVLDTNTVVSALLWEGPESQLLAAARAKRIELQTSAVLLDELLDVLPRDKFARKLKAAGLTVTQLVHRYALLAQHVVPADITARIKSDSDDDAVLACALAGNTDLIVSRDNHVLQLKHYHRIQIVTTADALRRIEAQK